MLLINYIKKMNKNKLDSKGHKHKTIYDNNKSLPSNNLLNPEKKNSNDIISHNKQYKIKDNDFKDLTNLVKNSVEKINDLFNQTEFQKKSRYTQKPTRALKFEISDIDEYDEINKSNDKKPKERSNTVEKSSKANFTFNINNFINVPNINTNIPNMTQISQEKNSNSVEHKEKINLKSIMNNKNGKSIYLNNIKRNMTIERKGVPGNKKYNIFNEKNNYSTLNESLYQIDEIQPNNSSTNNKLKSNIKNNINNQKNMKLSSINNKGSKTNYNMISNKTPEMTKNIKESNTNTPNETTNNNITNNMLLSGLSAITQNRKVLYRMPMNKKKENNLNLTQKSKGNNNSTSNNRPNKFKIKQNENNVNTINNIQNTQGNIQTKNNNKRNNDLLKNKNLKNKDIAISQSKKQFKTGDNFYPLKKDKDKEKDKDRIETENNNINDNINLEEINKRAKISQPHEQKSKNKNIKEEKYKQNSVNINLKIMDDLNCNKSLKSNNIPGNVSDRASSVNSPIHINIRKSKKRGGSIPERKNTKNDAQETEFIHNSSSRAFHQVINIFYGKEFPSKINTNEILKLMLFFNEYLINNNLLSDYQDEKNRKLLNDYSKYISNKIKVDFPQEQDIVVDPSIKCVKKIQRKWRKRKFDKYLEKNKKSEIQELKSMIVNKYIKNSGFKIKKILGLFNTIVENFDSVNKELEINEMFYQIQKLIHNKLTIYEKNLLYKEFINNVIYNNNKNNNNNK